MLFVMVFSRVGAKRGIRRPAPIGVLSLMTGLLSLRQADAAFGGLLWLSQFCAKLSIVAFAQEHLWWINLRE